MVIESHKKSEDTFPDALTLLEMIGVSVKDLKDVYGSYYKTRFWNEILVSFFRQHELSSCIFLSVLNDHPNNCIPEYGVNIVTDASDFGMMTRSRTDMTNPTEYLKALVRSKCTKPEDPLAVPLTLSPPRTATQAASAELDKSLGTNTSKKRKATLVPSPVSESKRTKLESKFSSTIAEKNPKKILAGLKSFATSTEKRFRHDLETNETESRQIIAENQRVYAETLKQKDKDIKEAEKLFEGLLEIKDKHFNSLLKKKDKTMSKLQIIEEKLESKLKDAMAEINKRKTELNQSAKDVMDLSKLVEFQRRQLCEVEQNPLSDNEF